MTAFCIAYPALTYRYGPFPVVAGMSRPRSELNPLIVAQADCPVVLADTPEKMKAFDDATAAIVCFQNPNAAFRDAAAWLTLDEILHAARQAGCAVRNAPAPLDDIPHDDPTTALAGC